MYNLFYVESPLQLLSAINARTIFKGKSILIINMSSGDRKNNDKQMRALLQEGDWFNVHIQKQCKNKYLSAYLSIFRLLTLYIKYKNKVDQYFWGEFRNLDMTILGGVVNSRETVLLDDGTFTITAQRKYIRNKYLPFKVSGKVMRLKLWVFRMMLNWDLEKVKSPNLCSFFDLRKSMLNGQVNYFTLPPAKEIALNENEIYYFGSKFSEEGYLELSSELKILKNAFEKYSGNQIFYIPHRDESSSKLKLIQEMGYIIKNLGCPAEIFFDEAKIMPAMVISSYSTTLYSCFSKFSNVSVIALDVRQYLKNSHAKINADNIYPYYQEVGIEIEKI